MEKFNFDDWNHKTFTTKDEAKKEIDSIGIIGDEIEKIVILDCIDNIYNSPYYLTTVYFNYVINSPGKLSHGELSEKIREFNRTHDKITLDMFPKDFKYMCAMHSEMPLILKMKSGKQFELFFKEHVRKDDWIRELSLSTDELKNYTNFENPVINHNKLYKFILNNKIVDINFDMNRYVNRFENKLDNNNNLSKINIEFENGYVMELIRSGPDIGYFIAIWNIEEQTYENFSIYDFAESFLGNIENISKVHN